MFFFKRRKFKKSIAEVDDFIVDEEQLKAFCKVALSHKSLGLDIEGNGFYRYPERVCLIQISVEDHPFIIDPLQFVDLAPLGEIFNNSAITKIVHAGDYDIRSLSRDYQFTFNNIFDTSIAAAFLGSGRLGLDAVLKEYLDVEVSKDKRLQRSDWTNRPLSGEALEYAANDVRYLINAMDRMSEKLESLGRLKWVEEEFTRLSTVRFEPKDEELSFLNVKGSKDIEGQNLSVLKKLYEFREDEAISKDRPPFKIISDSILVSIAREPQRDLSEIKGIGWWSRPEPSARLRKVIRRGLEGSPITRPRKQGNDAPRLSNKQRERANMRLRSLKLWRKNLGEELGLDPSILWPTSSLNKLSRSPGDLEVEIEHPEVRTWQRREFEDLLKTTLQKVG